MPEYLTPGVYVEKVAGGAGPISAVGTSTAAFFGIAPGAKAPLRDPVFVTSWSDFVRRFALGAVTTTPLAQAVKGFFGNGGSRLYIVNVGASAEKISTDDLALIAAIDGISLIAAPGYTDAESVEAILTDCEARGDRFAVLDMAEGGTLQDMTQVQAAGGLRPRTTDQGLAAVYTPWIEILDPITGLRVSAPPSGHLCGAYAGVDATRGVWKSPANIGLRGALGLTRQFSSTEQDILNPAGVNCIRMFADGIRVWGARTLGDAAGDWRYVPVRRLSLMIAQSIKEGTRWAVFEPNDLTLWISLSRDIGAFLQTMWRAGALMGAKPEDAFFVKCDAETVAQADIDAGRVNMLIGIAPVKPAEFVIIRISQSAGQAQIEEG